MRIKRAVATLLYLSSTPMAQIERELLQHYRDNSASGPIRAVSTRTRDVIDAVCRIAEFSGHSVAGDAQSDDIGVRLEIGLPAELTSLGQAAGNLITRGQYLALQAAGLSSPKDVIEKPDVTAHVLGPEIAKKLSTACDKWKVQS